MPYYSLEGLVACGKSSVLKYIAGRQISDRRICRVVTEPVELFTSYKNGVYNPLLEMQEDPSRNIVAGQIHILTQSSKHYAEELKRTKEFPCIISERSIFSSYVFLDCYSRKNYFSPFSKDFTADLWREQCEKVPNPECFIFIDASPEMCRDHLMKDKRRTISDRTTWTEEFLGILRCSHEKMFSLTNIPVKQIVVREHMTPADVAMAVCKVVADDC